MAEAPRQSVMPHAAPPKFLRLDVGGTRYTTLLSTLTSRPGSMIATMFRQLEDGEGIGLAQDPDEFYILDRDGPTFRYLLNFLRGDGSDLDGTSWLSRPSTFSCPTWRSGAELRLNMPR